MIPIVLGTCNTGQISEVIHPLLDSETLLVISTDLSHYLTQDQALVLDSETIDHILNLEAERLSASKNQACGLFPLKAMIKIARRLNWQPYLLHYSTSGNSAGSSESVVGYAAFAFFETQSSP